MTDPVIIFWSLLFSGFFSGMEIAYISSNKLHIEVLKNQGTIIGNILSKFVRNQSFFIGVTLVGNNLALVVYGIFMAKLMEPYLLAFLNADSRILLLVLQTLCSTLIVLITAEFLPKSIFLLFPDKMLRIFAFPMLVLYYLMLPIAWLVVKISRILIINLFGKSATEDKIVFGLTDLNHYINQNLAHEESEKSEVDVKILNKAIEFKETKIRECMIPRTEVVAIDSNASIKAIRKLFIESGHSKIIIYKESIDDIIGYCHVLELFKKPTELKAIVTPIIIVPETMPANELLVQFIKERKSLAMVVDEYGGTSGIVSLEDVMEEIFGEIEDEHDDVDLIEQKNNENNYILSARHEIDYLNDKYDLNIPKGDYDTLGGLILNFNEDIPELNQKIIINQLEFSVLSLEDARIKTVKLKILPPQD